MNMKPTLCLPIIWLLLSGCVRAQSDRSKLFQNWTTNIDQPISQLEYPLSDLEGQQPGNYSISNMAFLYDAKLYIHFHECLESRPVSEQAAQIAEQRQWLAQRVAQIHDAYREYEGGTLASYTAEKASVSATKKRISEIKGRMKDTSNKSDADDGK